MFKIPSWTVVLFYHMTEVFLLLDEGGADSLVTVVSLDLGDGGNV